jgi:hypothetical protein
MQQVIDISSLAPMEAAGNLFTRFGLLISSTSCQLVSAS